MRLAATLVVGVAVGVIATSWRPFLTGRYQADVRRAATAPPENQGEGARLSGELQSSRAEFHAVADQLAAARARGREADARYRELQQRVTTTEAALAKARADVAAVRQEVDRARERAAVSETTM